MAYTFATTTPAAPPAGRSISDMKVGDIAKVVSNDHKGATIMKTPKGFVSLSNAQNKLDRLSNYSARVEFLPRNSAVTLKIS